MGGLVTGVWFRDNRCAVAVQWDGDTIRVYEHDVEPYDVDVLGTEWEALPVDAEGIMPWIPLEQA